LKICQHSAKLRARVECRALLLDANLNVMTLTTNQPSVIFAEMPANQTWRQG